MPKPTLAKTSGREGGTVRRTLYLSEETLALLPPKVLIGPSRSAHVRAALEIFLKHLVSVGPEPGRAPASVSEPAEPATPLRDLVAVPLKLPAGLLASLDPFWGNGRGPRKDGGPYRSLSDLTRAALEYVAARTAG